MSPVFILSFMTIGALAFIGGMMYYFDAKAKRVSNRRKAQKEQLDQDQMDPEKYKILTNGKGVYKIQYPSGNVSTITIESIEQAKQYIERYVQISKEQWEEEHQVWTEVRNK